MFFIFYLFQARSALAAKGDDRVDLEDLKEMLEEANERKYPEGELLQILALRVDEADKCQTVVNQLANKKVRERK